MIQIKTIEYQKKRLHASAKEAADRLFKNTCRRAQTVMVKYEEFVRKLMFMKQDRKGPSFESKSKWEQIEMKKEWTFD